MKYFKFELQRFAESGNNQTGFDALELMHGIIQRFDLKTVDDTKLQDGSSTINSTLKFIGTFWGSLFFKESTRTTEVSSLTTMLASTVSIVEDIYAIREEKNKDNPSEVIITSKAEDYISNLASLTNAFKKLTSGKNSFILSVVSSAIGLASNLILGMDGLKEDEVEKINKSYIGLVQVSGAEIIKKFFSEGLADKLIDKPVNQILEIPGIREELGKQFTKGSGSLGLIFAAISGVLNGANKYDSNFKKYTEDGIPKDIAKHDAIIDALATFVHDTASSYAKGFDDTVFKWIQAGLSFIRGEDIPYYTDKNYVEVIADWLKTLNYKNSGTSKDDKFYVLEDKSMVYGDSGNDDIGNYAFSNVTIWGGHDDDTLGSYKTDSATPQKNSIFGGPGDDQISVYDIDSTIYGGTGKDFINVVGTSNEILGDEDDDKLYLANDANDNTVSGGTGDDFVVMLEGAKNTLIKYSTGDGNDTIYGFNEDDALKISGSYDTSIIGADVKITVANGSILLIGAAGKNIKINDKNIKVGEENPSIEPVPPPEFPTLPATVASPIIYGTEGNDKITNSKDYMVIQALDGDDTIENNDNNVTIDGGAGDDSIRNFYSSVKIDGGVGDDSIRVGGYDNQIDMGDGNDYIENHGDSATIEGGDGADIVNNSGKKVTINGGNGNDSISNGGWWYENGVDKWHDGGSNVTIDGGTGIDTIINYEGNSVKIDGGADDDSIYNWGSSVIIDGGDGNDSISNLNSYSLNVTINGGTGDDAIKNSGGNATIDGGAGNDLISLDAYADKNVILYNKDAGNDSIVGFNSTSTLQLITGIVDKIISDGKDILMTIENNTITLKDGFKIGSMSIIDENGTKITLPVMEINGLEEQDSFSNNWDNAIIKGIDGNDSIKNGGSSVKIDGGAGDDTITNSSVASNVSINSGLGNDSISNSGSNVTIVGGVGNDHIGNRGSSVTIKGEEGNDYISNSGDSVTIDGGADDDTISSNGNDYVINSGDSVSISGGTGNDSIYNYGDNVIIDGGEGENSISNGDYWNNGGSSVSINGGSDNNYIYNRGASSIIDSGEGNDSINNDSVSPSVIIVGGAGNDSISNHGDFVTMDGGDGNDTIRNDGKCSKIFSDEGNDSIDSWGLNVTINSGTGDDFIENKGNNATIDSGVGNDAIYNSGDMVTIATGAGKDTIYNYFGNRVIIDGGAGNDSIDNNYGGNVTINSGDGNDYIQNWCGSSAIINGGDGNDYIRNYNGDSVTVDSGIGDDSIYNEDSSNVIIDARMGNDSIRNDSVASNVTIDGGDGNDFIVNYGSTVTINGGTGDDFISLDSYQAKNNLIIYNINDGNDTINGIDGNDLLSISGGSYSTTKSGNDIVVMVGDGSIILKDAASLSTVNIDGEEGNLTELTFNNKTDSVITLPAQTEIVDASKRTRPIKITGNTLANSLFGGKGNDTLDGVEGDNTLTGGKGKDTFIFSSGKNIITDYETKDKISVGGGLSYAGFAVDGDDVILSFNDSDSLTIIKGAGKAINMNSTINFYTSDGLFDKAKKSITLATEVETFNAKNYSQLATIDGSSTDIVEIIGNSKANSIVAGTSGSTLNGGKGKDTLVGGDSSDIFVYSKGDGKDVIENYGAGDKISLGSDVAIRGVMIKNGNTIFKIGSGSVTVNDTTKVTLTSDGNDTIFSDGLFIIGDSIKVIGDYKGTIDLNEYSNIATIDASLDNKKLTINGDDEDNLLIGGRGKDKIYGNAGNDTLWGGKKNDTLYGGDGDDTFIFQAGNGNDVIADYQSGELLQILNKRGNEGDFKKSIFKNDTLTLTIQGGGKVILKDVDSSTDFNINGESYHVEGESLV